MYNLHLRSSTVFTYDNFFTGHAKKVFGFPIRWYKNLLAYVERKGIRKTRPERNTMN